MLPHFFEPIHCLLLNILDDSYDIHVFILNVVKLMLPVIVLLWKFACNALFVQYMQLVLFFFKSDIRRTFVVHVLQSLDVIALTDFQLLLLSQGHFS